MNLSHTAWNHLCSILFDSLEHILVLKGYLVHKILWEGPICQKSSDDSSCDPKASVFDELQKHFFDPTWGNLVVTATQAQDEVAA